jgi:predicted enzyme related to lactoylglutathione lyase
MGNKLEAKDSSTGQGTLLETIIIFTQRMEELAGFYSQALEIGPFDPMPGHLGCQLGPVYFGFDQVEEREGEGKFGATLWFTVDDLDATFERMVGMGVEVIYPPTPKPWGAVLAAVHDPDGNLLGLSQRQP